MCMRDGPILASNQIGINLDCTRVRRRVLAVLEYGQPTCYGIHVYSGTYEYILSTKCTYLGTKYEYTFVCVPEPRGDIKISPLAGTKGCFLYTPCRNVYSSSQY